MYVNQIDISRYVEDKMSVRWYVSGASIRYRYRIDEDILRSGWGARGELCIIRPRHRAVSPRFVGRFHVWPLHRV